MCLKVMHSASLAGCFSEDGDSGTQFTGERCWPQPKLQAFLIGSLSLRLFGIFKNSPEGKQDLSDFCVLKL